MATSFSQLKTDIPAWLNNSSTELAAELDKIIALAEDRLVRDLRVPAFHTVSPAAVLAAGDPLVPVPPDLVAVRFFQWTKPSGEVVLLEFKDMAFVLEYWPTPSATAAPRYYGRYDAGHFYLAPTPPAAHGYRIGYTRRLPPLSESNQTNWMTEEAANALLYACLLEAGAYAIDGQQVQTYTAFYKDAVAALNGEAKRSLRDDLRTVAVPTENA